MNNLIHMGTLAAFATVALCSFTLSTVPAETSASAGKSNNDLLRIVEDIPTAQAFLSDAVPESDIKRIVNAGVNAPSAMNRQPWHFTVITNAETIKQLADAQRSSMKDMKFPPRGDGDKGQGRPPRPDFANGEHPAPPSGERPAPPAHHGAHAGLGDSPVVIFISCNPGSEFDAGLACEAMNDMANLLGYGTKIASSVTMLFNGDKKDEYNKLLSVPEGQKVVTAILLGKVDNSAYDATTSATQRNAADKVVTFIK